MGVMHAGQEARGKISDRHYGDTELSLSLSHTSTHTLRPFDLLPETVKCAAGSNIEVIFQEWNCCCCLSA